MNSAFNTLLAITINQSSLTIHPFQRSLTLRKISTSSARPTRYPNKTNVLAYPSDPCPLTQVAASMASLGEMDLSSSVRNPQLQENDDGTSKPAFQYEPLNEFAEIRLIKIIAIEQPSDAPEEPILKIEMFETPLAEAGDYLAISYAWGDPEPNRKIICNGTELYVPENTFRTLFTIYHHVQKCSTGLYRKGKAVTLWIDALCIYSHRTTMNYFGSLRFVPQFFEGFNFTQLASQIWQYILPNFQFSIYRYALPILRLDIATYSTVRFHELRRQCPLCVHGA
jgi:hypothetical protein